MNTVYNFLPRWIVPKFGTAIGFLTAVTKCFEKLLSKILEAWIEFCCAKMKKKGPPERNKIIYKDA